MKLLALTLAGLASFVSVASAQTATPQFTLKDGQILGRTLGYVGDGMTGLAVVGIVFSAADPASRRDAEAIRGIIGEDLPAGRVRLQARLIPLEQLAGVIGIHALYVTTGLSADMEPVVRAAQRLHIPTISASMVCVQAGDCVVGYSTEPTVQILIDKAAAERLGVRFTQAFRMLVREK